MLEAGKVVQLSASSLKIGDLVYVRYQDHVLWSDKNPAKFNDPWILETCGWVSFVNDIALRIAWERLTRPHDLPADRKYLQQGITIVKSTIREVEVLST